MCPTFSVLWLLVSHALHGQPSPRQVRRMKILDPALCPCRSTEPGHHALAAPDEIGDESNHAFGYCQTGAPSHTRAKADSSSCLSSCATAVASRLALPILPQLSTLGRSVVLTPGYQSRTGPHPPPPQTLSMATPPPSEGPFQPDLIKRLKNIFLLF